MNWLKKLFYKELYIERQILRKPKRNEIGILTIPDASDKDIKEFLECLRYLNENQVWIYDTDVVISEKQMKYFDELIEYKKNSIKQLDELKKELKTELLSIAEHDDLRSMFPKVKTRCPVCYIKGIIENNIDSVFDKYLNNNLS